MEYEIELDIFQGPLELLYKLIKKNKIEISKVSLAKITDQYLSYLHKLNSFDIDIASQFMLIATELIELKTEQLLPGKKKEEKIESEENIIKRLKKYEKFKKAAYLLKTREEEAAKLFGKRIDIKEKITNNYILTINSDVSYLADIYLKARKSTISRPDKLVEKKEKIDIDYINEDTINVRSKINEIINHVNIKPEGVEFKQLIKDKNNCLEIIVTLLSVLELIHMQKLKIEQDDLFANIKVYTVNEKVCL